MGIHKGEFQSSDQGREGQRSYSDVRGKHIFIRESQTRHGNPCDIQVEERGKAAISGI